MQFKQRRELKRTRIEIIPMIDTIFFLLVFFMLSSLALTKLNGLPVNLPHADSAARQPPAQLTVTIDRARHIFVNGEGVGLEILQAKLLEQSERGNIEAATVIINADRDVPHGLVVQCIDAAREIGITHFAIATTPEGAENLGGP